jgi:hypothetical protein
VVLTECRVHSLLGGRYVYKNHQFIDINRVHTGLLTFRTVIVGHRPIPVERDTDLAALRFLELFTIEFDGIRM